MLRDRLRCLGIQLTENSKCNIPCSYWYHACMVRRARGQIFGSGLFRPHQLYTNWQNEISCFIQTKCMVHQVRIRLVLSSNWRPKVPLRLRREMLLFRLVNTIAREITADICLWNFHTMPSNVLMFSCGFYTVLILILVGSLNLHT